MPNKYVKPLIDPKKLGLNPLVGVDFKIIADQISDGSFHNDDGIWLPHHFLREKENKTCVYTKAEYRLITSRFKPCAKSLFLWLIYELDYGQDYIWINKDRYMGECGITSVNTYKRSIEELTRILILYPTTIKGVYWINPMFFFAGNRLSKYPKHVEVDRELGKRIEAPVSSATLRKAI